MKRPLFLTLLVMMTLLLASGRPALAEEPAGPVVVPLGSTTLSGYVDSSFSTRPTFRTWWSRFACRWGLYRAASRSR
jgi:hypothetical protein